MNRLKNYVNLIFKSDLTENGFVYVSDENLFVLDDLAEIMELYEFQLKDIENKKRKIALNAIKDVVGEDLNKDPKLKKEFLIIIDYQIFLEEKGFDNRFKRKVRDLITKELLDSFDGLKVSREKYFYFPSRVKLNFIDSLNLLISSLKQEANKNSEFFYRGHSDIDWELIPAIYRTKWINDEHKMFREILLRNNDEFVNTKTTFEKLTIMQHYGLPTRLLDITKNPLVALYFACKSHKKVAGELIVFNPSFNIIKYSDSDTVSILSNLSKSERDLKIIKNQIDFNTKYIPGLKLLHLIKEEKPYFQDIIQPKDLSKVLVVKPINNNERIKRQLGYFFLFGIKEKITEPADINSLYQKNNIIQRFIIEEHFKDDILSELEAVGISDDTLFPEIENGTEYIKSRY